MKKKKILKIVIPAAVVVIIIGAVTVNNAANAGKQMAEAMQVEGVTVETGDVAEIIETNGTVISGEQKMIFSPVNASVETADFEVGNLVKAGTQLVTFNLKDLEEQNQKAELNVRSSELGYQDSVSQANKAASRQADARNKAVQLQAQVSAKEQEVQNLTNAIAGAASAQEASRKQEEKEMQEQVSSLQKQIKNASKEADVAKKAYDKAGTEQQTAQVNFDAAAAAAESNPQALETAREKLNTANKSLTDAKSAYDTNQQAVDALQQQLNALQGNSQGVMTESVGESDLQQFADGTVGACRIKGKSGEPEGSCRGGQRGNEQRGQGTDADKYQPGGIGEQIIRRIDCGRKKGITAEFDGVISDKQIMEGATVTQGMQLFTLQSIEDVNVEVTLSKNVFAKVKEGQKAEITLAGETYQGTVQSISRIATSGVAGTNQAAVSSASIMATIHIDNPDENIFLGVDAKVTIQAAEANDVIILPTEAVNIGKDGTFCWVNKDGILTKRSITTGVSSNEYAEITQGIDEGEVVIPDPGNHEEGDAITVIDAVDGGEMPEGTAETDETLGMDDAAGADETDGASDDKAENE